MQSDDEDVDLIDKYRAQDLEAFAAFYSKYWLQLGSIIRRITGASVDEARDHLQTAFQKFIEFVQSDRYRRGKGSVKALLFRMGRNLATNVMRDKKIASRGNLKWAAMYGRKAISRSFEEEIQTEEEFEVTFRDITEEDMDLLTLSVVDELSHQEISEITDIPPRTVGHRIEKAIQRTRELRKRKLQTEAGDE